MAQSDHAASERPQGGSVHGLPPVEIPRETWAKARRPFRGTFFRWSFALTFVLLGLTMASIAAKAGLIAAGIVVFAALPSIMDRRLAAIEREVAEADRAAAARLLASLEQRRLVALFAPHAWVAVQKGRLHLTMGDGRAAAKAFAEAARLVGDVNHAALVSARAHALTLSGDRREARALLSDLEQRNQLGARDHLDLGIAMLEDPGKMRQTMEHLQAAAEALGEHPRVLAALTLAHARADAPDEARETWARAQAVEDTNDPVAADLFKRARKAMRPLLEAQDKRNRRADKRKSGGARVAQRTATSDEPARGGKKKKQKKDRRKERRDRRKASKQTKKTAASPTPEPAPTKTSAGGRGEAGQPREAVTQAVSAAAKPEPAKARDEAGQETDAKTFAAASKPAVAKPEPAKAQAGPGTKAEMSKPAVAKPEPARAQAGPSGEPSSPTGEARAASASTATKAEAAPAPEPRPASKPAASEPAKVPANPDHQANLGASPAASAPGRAEPNSGSRAKPTDTAARSSTPASGKVERPEPSAPAASEPPRASPPSGAETPRPAPVVFEGPGGAPVFRPPPLPPPPEVGPPSGRPGAPKVAPPKVAAPPVAPPKIGPAIVPPKTAPSKPDTPASPSTPPADDGWGDLLGDD